ncbi:MAG: tetratricopeptide repeat protein, partial [Bryocella sp.]
EGDSTNAAAYQSLINLDHQSGNDAEAYQVLQSMPPTTYEQAMQTQGFPSLVAAIYSSQKQYDLARQTLEAFIQNQQSSNQPVPVAAEVQLAGIYQQRGDTANAFPIYSSIVRADPENNDAWNGLVTGLHAAGRDQEALAEIQQIPPNVRLKLEQDPAYLQTVGSIYAGLKQYSAAMSFYHRVQQRYVSQRITPPSDIDIQEAWLLFNAHNDPMLLRQLLMLGGRGDLTDTQRMTVQTIWANWAVRRANDNIAQGNYKRALAILNAAAKSFPDNLDVLKALGSGYSAVGLSKQAVEIYRAQDLSQGSVEDYRAAVGSALTANDLKDAETWLRFGLDQYPRDGALLVMAAKFEAARGDSGRAAEYYKASLKVFPKDDPGSMLTDEMLRPLAVRRVQHEQQSRDLATLLSETDPKSGHDAIDASEAPRPYLPSYRGTPVQAPVQLDQTLPNGQYSPQRGVPGGGYIGNTTPGITGSRAYDPYSPDQQQQLQQRNAQPNQDHEGRQQRLLQQQRNSTLGNYTPQSQLHLPILPTTDATVGHSVLYLHPDPRVEATYGPYVSYDPSAGLPQRREVAQNDASITAHFVTASFHSAPQQYDAQQDAPQQTQARPLHLTYPHPGQNNAAQQNVLPPPSYLPAPRSKAPRNSPQTASQDGAFDYTPTIDYKPPVNGYAPPKTIQLPASERRTTASPRQYETRRSTRAQTAPYSPSRSTYQESFPTPTRGYSATTGERTGPITSSRRSAY